ncbi:MAG: hypothetical protein B9J98_04070 [Candidatus Terraquivivens tikiterensis]|uniref:Type II secretion system protein GspF domain-containing protein n=1 Tax=Candidatus Terraquivivens tikiterensis TaxID=1980982 RepID=A0A2R7Y522_9ARCH|nr:MAG: hypothetical protein B9J98_04070 [Candidatus Terraquivivens tikiterensis]
MRTSWLYYGIAATLAASWIVYAELVGPRDVMFLAPAPATLFAAVLGNLLARPFSDRLADYSARLVEKGALRKTPLEVAEELGTHLAMASAVAAAYITSVIVTAMTFRMVPPLFPMLFCLLPIAPMALSLASYGNRIVERKERIDSELPFFAVFATVMSHCGMTLYGAMRMLARTGSRLFEQMSLESREVERMAELTGKGVIESLEASAMNSPHEGYQSLVLSTTSVWRMGGNVPMTLEDRAAELLKSLEDRFDRYAANVAVMMEVFLIALLLLPMGIALATIVNPEQATGVLTVTTWALLPGMSFGMYAFLRLKSPRKPDEFDVRPKHLILSLAAGAATAAALLCLSLSMPLTVVFTSSSALASTVLYLMLRKRISEVEDGEAELRRWLRDVAEYRRLGYTPTDAVVRTRRHRYRKGFQSFLSSMASRVAMGLSLWEAGAAAKSWLTKVSVYVLNAVNVSGGGSPQLMEKLIELLRGYGLAREKARARLSLFKYLAYSIPFITSFMITMIIPIPSFMSMGLPAEAHGSLSGLLPGVSVSAEQMLAMTDTSMLMIAFATLSYTLMVNRASDMHPWNVWRVAVAMVCVAGAYAAVGPLADLVGRLLGGFTGAGGG